jgi:hypothetical protein
VKLKFIISESQKKKIFKKKLSSLIDTELEKNILFSKKIIPTQKNSKSIGGFLRPIDDYIRDTYKNLTEKEIQLILITVVSIYFKTDNDIENLYSRLKKLGVDKYMAPILKKTDKLYNKFSEFLDTKGIKTKRERNINDYLSLIPILPKIIS